MSYLVMTSRWALIVLMAIGAPLWCCCLAGGEMGGVAEAEMVDDSPVMSCHGAMEVAVVDETKDEEPCDCGHEMQLSPDLMLELGIGNGFVISGGYGMDWVEAVSSLGSVEVVGRVVADRGPPGGRSVRILLGRMRV